MKTIVEALVHRAKYEEHKDAFTFLDDSGEVEYVQFSALETQVKEIAKGILAHASPGEPVIILFPQGLEYIRAFLACMYAGVVAVPLYPPQSTKNIDRVKLVAKDCGAVHALAANDVKELIRKTLPDLKVLTLEDAINGVKDICLVEVNPSDTAFVQYTSGSTGDPKGVVVTHGNIVANLESLQEATLCSSSDIFCNWLPLFHDLGLVNTVLLPIYLGAHSIHLSPARFIRRPATWLEAISHYKATICGAPNFAFDYCVKRIRVDSVDFDLSSWRIAFNAAEPVKADTLMEFARVFEPHGFAMSAFYPSYGMAEATVFIAGGRPDDHPSIKKFNEKDLKLHKVGLVKGNQKALTLVSCGRPQSNHRIEIVCPKTRQVLSENSVGEIWFSGPSVAKEYWGKASDSREIFKAKLDGQDRAYLKTGDLGFIHKGELFVTGRIKDVIIVNGVNYYPSDIEHLVYKASKGLVENGGVAFEYENQAVAVYEVEKKHLKNIDFEKASSSIQTEIYEFFGIMLGDIVFIPARSLSRTSSGKVQRGLTKKQYASEGLQILYSQKTSKDRDLVSPSLEEMEISNRLVDLWKEEFNEEEIGLDDSFIQLGGNSIFATRILHYIEAEWGKEITIKDLFENPNINLLSRKISGAKTKQITIDAGAAYCNKLSFSQQALWTQIELSGSGQHYHNHMAYLLEGELNKVALEMAFQEIVNRHSILTTCIIKNDRGEPQSHLKRCKQFKIQYVSLDSSSKQDNDDRSEFLIKENIGTAFDLSSDCMLRVLLIRKATNKYLLSVCLHHIASDGWSVSILLNELNRLYLSYINGDLPLTLEPLQIQYSDYVRWQAQYLDDRRVEACFEHWKKQLQNAPEIHSLPLDKVRPQIQTFEGKTFVETLDKDLVSHLKSACKTSNATVFEALYTAFAVLLGRWGYSKDIVIGTPVANRRISEISNLVGFFVNVLVLRCDLAGAPTFNTLLTSARKYLTEAFDNQDLPFDVLVERLCPTRHTSYNPLVQVMLVLQDSENNKLDLYGLKTREYEIDSGYSKYDLSLNIVEQGNQFKLDWEFNSDIFHESSIKQLAACFRTLLKSLLDNPDANVYELNLLDDRFFEGNQKGLHFASVEYSGVPHAHAQFEQQVVSHPQKVAIEFADESGTLTYSQLNFKANQLANYLKHERQLEPNLLIGVYLARSCDLLVSLLAISKIGCAYLPLDPDNPEERIRFIVEDAKPQTVITTKDFSNNTGLQCSRVIEIDDLNIRERIDQLDSSNLALEKGQLKPDDLVYVIYTSGSSGQPKGVMVEHRSLVNLMCSDIRCFGFSEESKVLLPLSLAFDAGNGYFWSALSAGCTLCLSDARSDLFSTIQNKCISHAIFPSSLLSAQVGKPGATLKVLISGGDQCDERILGRLDNGTRYFNVYGPTEATVTTTVSEVHAGEPVNIGKPISNVQVYVLDEFCKQVPPGVAGELYIGGAGLARGYLNREALTAEKFIANPFYDEGDPHSSPRLYKTGDLARWLTDEKGRPTNLVFLGRIDHQVKIRGFRIELGEIEHALNQHAEVKDALVVAKNVIKDGSASDKRLVAYLVSEKAAADDTFAQNLNTELRQALSKVLPEHMLPASYVYLDAFPLTPNGKIDRKALPEVEGIVSEVTYVAPRTETEQQLVAIWQEVLGVERVGIHDNFFHLGGHSLLVIQVLSRLQKLKLNLHAREFFSTPVLHELAAVIDKAEQQILFQAPENKIPQDCEHITPDLLPLIDLSQSEIDDIVSQAEGGVSNVQDIYPLAPLQEGILFHHMMVEEGGDPYIMPALFEVKGKATLDNLLTALQKIIDRHDVLRTAILWKGLPQAVQLVHKKVSLPVTWPVIPEGETPRHFMENLCAPDSQRMDLQAPCLLQLSISKDSIAEDSDAQTYLVLLQLHHVVSDHVGLELIQQELMTLMSNMDSVLDTPLAYREFVAHTHHQARTHNAEDFFKNMLGDVEDASLPFGLSDVQGDGSRIVEQKAAVPAKLCKQIRQLSQQQGISPASFFHAVWGMVVGACSGREDPVFGTVMSGRLQGTAGAERMLGTFINTLPFRIKLASSARELVEEVHQNLSALIDYEQSSLTLAQSCSGLSPDATLFSALLNYRHSVTSSHDMAGSELFENLSLLQGHERTNYPFCLSVDDLGDGFELDVQVDKSVDVSRVVAYLQEAIANLVLALKDNRNAPVSNITILPETERKILLKDCNATDTDYPQDLCIHSLFEAQVEKNPEHIAVVFEQENGESESLSYAQLNKRANQLAHYLRQEKAVGPETLVGLCVERSLDMVIGILGILKAGGAYVPLDPDYPPARLHYMLEDAQLTTVLTQKRVLEKTAIDPARALCLDDEKLVQELQVQSTENPHKEDTLLTAQHLAYVIYTSGSTGQPKGVMIEHRSTVALLSWSQTVFADDLSAVLASTSICFDLSVFELFAPLSAGGQIILVNNILSLLKNKTFNQRVSLINTVPSAARTLLQENAIPTGVNTLNLAGEPLSQTLVEALYTAGVKNVFDLYGPSEDTTYSTFAKRLPGHPATIGKPISNTRVYLLQPSGTLSISGASGELYIGGAGLARGYLNREALTAEKFIANPFYDESDPHSSPRLYKTGDLARWLTDDKGRPTNLAFLGRIDHQVKIRGFRIELGEIEHALNQHAEVKDALVVAKNVIKDGSASDKRLVAYLVSEKAAADDTFAQNLNTELRLALSKVLPEHMLPASYVYLDAFPLTPNGKIDRKALPEADGIASGVDYVAPRTETEQQLVAIWQEVLGVERVGIHDNFFHLGGHSLLVIQVLSRLQKLKLNLHAREFFSAPVLHELAAVIDKAEQQILFHAPENKIPQDCEHITPDLLPLIDLSQSEIDDIVSQAEGGVSNVQDIYPLAPLQEGILFHHMMVEEGGDPYIMPALFEVKGKATLDNLLTALQKIIDRHDVLRTAILWKGLPQAVQLVHKKVSLPVTWPVIPEGETPRHFMENLCAPDSQRMDLQAPCLLQLSISKDSIAEDSDAQTYLVLLQLHHVVSDHVGLELIQQELMTLMSNMDSVLDTPLAYREFVAHTHHQARTHNAEDFFKNMLGDVEDASLPFGLSDVQGDGSRIVEQKAAVPAKLCKQIRQLSQQQGISPASFFHAVWGMVVGACSGREDPVFGTVMSGRLQGTAGAERMLGTFINTLPFRIKLASSARELVEEVHQNLSALIDYEQSSLTLAQSCSGLSPDATLFSALLNYRHSVTSSHDMAGSELFENLSLLQGHERTNYPFCLSVDDLGDGFELDVQVDKSVDVSRVVAYLQEAIANLVLALQENNDVLISRVTILPENEKQTLLQDCNATDTDYPQDLCIHALFEAQVEKNPEQIAVVFESENGESESLSYAQLNNCANQLAHYLRQEKAVGPETLVGLCVERSLDMVIGILGILKAGGAYVPLDPDYPPARLHYMLEDAQLTTVLTQKSVLEKTAIDPVRALCLDDEKLVQELQVQSTENPRKEDTLLTAQHLAYVIYTSGSTGQPKGVMIEHRSTVALLSWSQTVFADDLSAVLASTSICFDLSVFELFAPLSAGGQIILVNNILSLLKNKTFNQRVSLINTVPSAARTLLQENAIPAGVNTLNLAGEPLSQTLVEALYTAGVKNVFDLYGPSEDTTYSTFAKRLPGHPATIGKPISNTRVYLLQPSGTLSISGASGELYIGGAGLARGYLNREALTAEKFIANPFYDESDPHSSPRLYKTGDLARWLTDDKGRPTNLAFLGRIDHQVKIRGFRIELGEIEHALNQHAEVKDALVVAKNVIKDGSASDKRLVAYLVSEKAAADDTFAQNLNTELRLALSKVLPEHMLPASYVYLDAFPLTPNGKIDRKALPEADGIASGVDYVAPRTETEQQLVAIWQEVLGVERVGIHDNFFHLGGHSLLVIQVLSRLQKLKLNLHAREFFSTPVLHELAAVIDKAEQQILFHAPENKIPQDCEHITPDLLPLIDLSQSEIDDIVSQAEGGVSNVQDIYPLAPLQEGILFHHMMVEEGGDPYIMPALFEVKGKATLDNLLTALQKIIDRHDVLRTAILWKGLPQAVQLVHKKVSLPVTWPVIPEGEAPRHFMENLCAPDSQRMDLQSPCLLQLSVSKDSDAQTYFVLLQLHHVVSDHVGLELIQHELMTLMSNMDSVLDTPLAYREFVAHTHHQARTHNAEAFFKNMLGDVEDASLPFGLSDVQGDGSRIVEQKAAVPAKLCKQIRQLSQQQGISPASFFHAVWGMVVGACSGREDPVFGTVMSGRLQGTAGAERMLGTFINTLPFRIKLASSARELVEEVHQNLSALIDYEQSSLTLAQSCSGLSPDATLFSALLNYRHSVTSSHDMAGSELFENLSLLQGHERTNYPFCLSVDDLGDGFELDVQVDKSVDVSRVVAYLQEAIANLVLALQENNDVLISRVTILPENEKQTLLQDCNATDTDYPQDLCIHALFEAQVEKNPEQIAVVFESENGESESLSYAQLNNCANQLAHYLRQEKAVGPETLVGLCVERSLDMVIGILGILKAGGAYVPLDPDYPPARLHYMLEDAQLTTVLTQKSVLEKTAIDPVRALCLDDEKLVQELQVQSTENPRKEDTLLTAQHLAYVIYTSGSTGQPKGVMIEHRSTVALLSWSQTVFADDLSAVLASTSICFDLSVFELFAPLSAGGQIILVNNILSLLKNKTFNQRVSLINTVPSAARTLLQENAIPAGVNTLNLAGEPLSQTLVEALYTAGVKNVFDLYGPSEDTTYSTFAKRLPGHPATIGKPISNTRVYLLQPSGTLSISGASGELYIGGAGLARGYLNREALTAEKFIANPFYDESDPHSSPRLYKTGDLARWLTDDKGRPTNLAFLGRIDHQVKIRGFRIELGEIEHALNQHAEVKDALVVAKNVIKDGSASDKRLVAYLVSEKAAADDTFAQNLNTELRLALSKVLPEHMLPASYVYLDAFPLTPNGKIDRKALPEADGIASGVDYVAPRTETEQQLAAIWQEVLGVERVGIHDNFFHLGGHSLLATRLVSIINQRFGKSISLKTIFEKPVIKELVKNIDDHGNQERISQIKRNNLKSSLSSFAQQRLWLLDKIDGGSQHYNIPSVLELIGEVNQYAVNYAFTEILRQHESLRSCFQENDQGELIQVVQSHTRFNIEVTYLDKIDSSKKEQLQNTIIKEFIGKPFNLERDLMLRAHLIKVSESHYFLLVNMHHIASDGWSASILIKQFCQFYTAYLNGEKSANNELEIQYSDYALWQRQYLSGVAYKREMQYWEVQLAGLPEIHGLKLDKPRPDIQTFSGSVETYVLNETTTSSLRDLCKRENVTLFISLHAVFSIFLSRYSNETDIVMGTPIANRNQREVENLIGFFVNTLVLRSSLDGNMNFLSALNQSKSILVDAYSNQNIPFEKIVEKIKPKRALGYNPLCQIMLVLNQDQETLLDIPGLEISPCNLPSTTAKYDLSLNVTETGNRLSIDWEYNSDIFSEVTIRNMQMHFANLIESLLARPQDNIYSVSMLGVSERRRIIKEFNSNTRSFPGDKCFNEVFEEQARSTPKNIAIVHVSDRGEVQETTYEELNARANQLSHFLIKQRGVKSGDLIGIFLDRSANMVVALLAVLKAGAAYVPLDPDYPKSRLDYMLKDADLSIVLTTMNFQESGKIFSDKESPYSLLCLDDEKTLTALRTFPESNVSSSEVGLSSNDLAYVIYTSGSTGQPKGVMVEHRSLVNLFSGLVEKHGITENDSMPFLASFAFDIAIFELFLPLMSGGRTYIVSRELMLDLSFLSEALQHCTLLHAVPALMSEIVEHKKENISSHPKIRKLFVGGDKVSARLVDRMKSTFEKAQVFELYGPTEATILSTSKNTLDRKLGETASVIGSGLANTALYVFGTQALEADLVPVGVAGELGIAGEGVARGYLNMPQLSNEKFIRNIYDSEPARIYKTGDLVRWVKAHDGNYELEFLGRTDNQVKIRGFRIETDEIENKLILQSEVDDALVLAEIISETDSRLIAYVIVNSEFAGNRILEKIKNNLEMQMPSYMVPSVLIPMDKFPLTPNGKVDRNALPKASYDHGRPVYENPIGSVECVLVQVLEELLGVEKVGRFDDFFEMGGHSILAIQLVKKMRNKNYCLDIQNIFKFPKISDMALTIYETQEQRLIAPKNGIPEGSEQIQPHMLPLVALSQKQINEICSQVPGGVKNIQDIYPLSALQKGILFHHLSSSKKNGDAYILPVVLKVKSQSKLEELVVCIQKLVKRHDVLRTLIFAKCTPEPVQVVLRSAELNVQYFDLIQHVDLMEQLKERIQPKYLWMDLDKAPLVKLDIAKHPSTDEYFVILCNHHIIMDHIAHDVLLDEVREYLDSGDEAWLLKDRPTQYRDFVAHTLNRNGDIDAKAYFTNMLADLNEPTIPFNITSTNAPEFDFTDRTVVITDQQYSQITNIVRNLSISPAAFFHAAWSMVLGICSGKSDIVFGTVMSGRMQGIAGEDNAVGAFINTVPIRINLNSRNSVMYLKEVHRQLRSLLPFEQTSLTQAQACSGISRETPLFNALFNYRHSRRRDGGWESSNVEFVMGYERTNYPFNISVDDFGDGFAFSVQVDRKINVKYICQYMELAVCELIRNVTNQTEINVASIPLLTEQERQQLLVDVNATHHKYDGEQSFIRAFEGHAERAPHAIAAIYLDGIGSEQSISYERLNSKANLVARKLIERNLRNSHIAIFTERGIELLIAILGVLKSGNAYVPLDPGNPKERLKYIVNNAKIDSVVTTKTFIEENDGFGANEMVNLLLIDDISQADSSVVDSENETENGYGYSRFNDIAYVIYTSGSTGKPKGVQVTNKGLVNYLDHAASNYFKSCVGSVASTPIGFDATITSLLAPLFCGKFTYLIPQGEREFPLLKKLMFSAAEPLVFKLTPAHMDVLLFDGVEKSNVPHQLIIGGEQLTAKSLLRWKREVLPEAIFVNEYGPTETVVGCSTFTLYNEKDIDASQASVPIGKPIQNTQLYVVNHALNLLPVGIPGELLIGGDGVSPGYLDYSKGNSESFVEVDFEGIHENSERRVYRTGDLVKWRKSQDGASLELEFIGRVDHQIKLRGNRIEPAEIELAINSHASVQDSIVMPLHRSNNETVLIAYVILSAGVSLNSDLKLEFIEHLSRTLPAYMVPTAYVSLEAFPLTLNGKVDRESLPKPDYSDRNTGYVSPKTETEVKLVEVWESLLAVDKIGINDNFFMIGGQSILAMKLLALVNEMFEIELNINTIFEADTIAKLSSHIDITIAIKGVASGEMDISKLTEEQLDHYLELMSDEEIEA